MRTTVKILMVLAIFGCKTQKEIVPTEPVAVAPYWVKTRPITPAFYIGIGSARINTGTEYQNTAKENALSDLASEIKVNVNSNSLLHTLEQNSQFEQSYLETIQTSSNLDLEGFEIVDTWADATHYYTFYRLDKSVYAEIQRKKKETGQKQSLDFFNKGMQAADAGIYPNAVQYYLQGLQSIEAFWNEENEVVGADGASFLLDNALYANLNDLIAAVQITVESPLNRSYTNAFTPEASILVKSNNSGTEYSDVPLYYSYPSADGKYNGKTTNGKSEGTDLTISDTPANQVIVLKLQVDTDALFSPFFKDPFMRDLLAQFTGSKTEIPVAYTATKVWIKSSEQNMNEIMSPQILSAAMRSSLASKGVRFVDSKVDATVKIAIRANTKAVGESQGFSSSYLNYDIEIREAETNTLVFNLSKSNVKGVDMDFKKAGTKAYRNLAKNLEQEIISKLKNKIY